MRHLEDSFRTKSIPNAISSIQKGIRNFTAVKAGPTGPKASVSKAVV